VKRVAAIVTAAGASRRFGPASKLHAPLGGLPLLERTLRALQALPLAQVLVVLAPGDETSRAIAARLGFDTVENPEPAAGLGSSIACGARALSRTNDGTLLCLGDMPLAPAAAGARLIRRYEDCAGGVVLVPVHDGRRGHPVLFDRAHFATLAALGGDRGARALLTGPAVVEVPVDDAGVLLDVDTPADLAALETGAPGG
jgi:molybdenum cofactor cytidylyltransferase